VVSERHGRWGTAIEVPGLGAMNKGLAQVWSVSCASAGNCAAGGYYQGRGGNLGQGFVVSERHGRWGRAIEVPGLRTPECGRVLRRGHLGVVRLGGQLRGRRGLHRFHC